MEANVDENKKYIRDHIGIHEQEQFYNYFLSLPDSSHFEHWNVQKTAEVVNGFRSQQRKVQTGNKEVEQKKQGLTSENGAKLEKVEVKPSCQTSKQSTCLNLLEEIQEKSAIKANETARKPDHREENWLNINNFSHFLTNTDPAKFNINPDLFRNFDTIITKKTDSKSCQSPARMSMPVISTKKQVEKKKKNLSIEVESLKSSGEKDKGKDKLFKLKISQKVACKKVEVGIQVKSISILHHEMVHRIFLPDYAMYYMEVRMPSQIKTLTCKRTYDDFVLLRNTLQHLYPYIKTPFLQSGSWLSENDIALIKKNKTHLQLFMKGIIEHPLLSKLDIVAKFVTIIQHKQLKVYFQSIQKVQPPRGLAEVCSSSGSINIELSSEQYQLITALPKWQNIFSDYFQKYGDLLSALAGQLQAVDQTYSQLQKMTTQMQGVLRQLTDRNTQIQRQQDFQTFFSKQEEFYTDKKLQTQGEMSALIQTLIPLVKYERLNIGQFKPDFQSAQKLTEKYLKRLENQPESPSSAQEIQTIIANNRFREDLWQESQNIQFFKLQLGYLHSALLQQTHLFSNRLIDTLDRVWRDLYGKNQKEEQVIKKQRTSIKSCQY